MKKSKQLPPTSSRSIRPAVREYFDGFALPQPTVPRVKPKRSNGRLNKVQAEDKPIHDWYRFVLSFPPHLVRDYLARFEIDRSHRVLDPFCGTGTTLVECKKMGIPSIGIEANPMAQFAARVKTDWGPDPKALVDHAAAVAESATCRLIDEGVADTPLFFVSQDGASPELRRLPDEAEDLLLANSMSPKPLHKALVLLDFLERYRKECFHSHELLAFAKSIVLNSSNLRFGPEVGLGKIREDPPVVDPWFREVTAMASDLQEIGEISLAPAQAILADSRCVLSVLEPNSIDAVITSPPYPNEKDYTRTTRLESVLLGFLRDREDLRRLKRTLLRSNTRGVYKHDDDDLHIGDVPEIERIAQEIERRRLELGKTSGFERLYARVTKLYFGGMRKHLADLRHVLRRGAWLAYVVGDQASYLQVMIRTGQLLAQIAERLGYQVHSVDLFRTRLATATREDLREEVVVLRWHGKSRGAGRDR